MTRSNCTNTNLATTHTPPQDHGGGYDVVAKNRSGPVNRVAVGFQGHYCRFTPLARDAEPPGAAAGEFH